MATSAESATEPASAKHALLKLVAVADINGTDAQQEHSHDLDNSSDVTSHFHGSHRFFKSATWSPDGTSVITNSNDNHISTYVVPPDLLDDRPRPLTLTPYTTIPSHNSVPTMTVYPPFNLTDPSTTLVLINPHNEAYITPQSLLFQPEGTDFIAGGDTSIATFDLSRPGEEPVMWYRTGPKRSRDTSWRNPATSLKGIISTMALDRSKQHAGAGHGVLAAGSFSRQIGLYNAAGRGECIAAFPVGGTEAEQKGLYSGTGITQVLWSSCGRYLFAVERKSDGVLVYDVRVTGKMCGFVSGRNAMTNQRMNVDVVERGGRTELWAGGVDGILRCWHNPQSGCGEGHGLPPSWDKTVHENALNGVGVHPGEDVLLTASGQRSFLDLDDPEQSTEFAGLDVVESTLKLWDMAAETSTSSEANLTS